MTPRYDAMLEAIDTCHRSEPPLFASPLEELEHCAAIAGNTEPERQACEIRLRAERGLNAMLEEAAGFQKRARAVETAKRKLAAADAALARAQSGGGTSTKGNPS